MKVAVSVSAKGNTNIPSLFKFKAKCSVFVALALTPQVFNQKESDCVREQQTSMTTLMWLNIGITVHPYGTNPHLMF